MEESLRVQLAELNARARAYTTQLWQVPFAYMGILYVAIGGVLEKQPAALPIVFLAGALIGVCVLIQMYALLEGSGRAVTNVNDVERRLGLPETAHHKPYLHVIPILIIAALNVLGCFIGLYLHSS
jgi:hypothetical protein